MNERRRRLNRIEQRLGSGDVDKPSNEDYRTVQHILDTAAEMGGHRTPLRTEELPPEEVLRLRRGPWSLQRTIQELSRYRDLSKSAALTAEWQSIDERT